MKFKMVSICVYRPWHSDLAPEDLQELEAAATDGWRVVGITRTYAMRDHHFATVLMQRDENQ